MNPTRGRSFVLAATLAVTGAVTLAPMGAMAAGTQTPYAGLEAREIKALSRQETADLLAGRGMGLALAGELNRHPGPKHVLELEAKLALTSGQKGETETLKQGMKARAIELGREIVAAERDLDRRFALAAQDGAAQDGAAFDDAALRRATARIAVLRGELRFVHLRAHLVMRRILTATQIARYDALRGYAGRATGAKHGGGHGGH